MSQFGTRRATVPPDRILVRCLDHGRVPLTKGGRGIVWGTAASERKAKSDGRRTEPDLQLGSSVLDERCVAGLIEDWIVPAVVERIIEESFKPSPDTDEST